MRHILTVLGAGALGALLAGCASAPPGPMLTAAGEPLTWVRTDGQSGRANPALVDQFAADRAACGLTAAAENNATLRAAEPCMRARGYVLVPASQAEATAAQFRAQSGFATPAG